MGLKEVRKRILENAEPELKEALQREYKKGTSKNLQKKAIKQAKIELSKAPEYSYDVIEDALRKCDGLVSFAAEELKCPVDVLRGYIKKSKRLREALFTIRERNIDLVEGELMKRIVEKKDPILMMFYLKNMGVHRGWTNEKAKAGSSLDKPIYIKIQPASPEVSTSKKAIKPVDIKLLPQKVESNEEDYIDI